MLPCIDAASFLFTASSEDSDCQPHFMQEAVKAQGYKSLTQGHTQVVHDTAGLEPGAQFSALSCGVSHHAWTKIPDLPLGQLSPHTPWLLPTSWPHCMPHRPSLGPRHTGLACSWPSQVLSCGRDMGCAGPCAGSRPPPLLPDLRVSPFCAPLSEPRHRPQSVVSVFVSCLSSPALE